MKPLKIHESAVSFQFQTGILKTEHKVSSHTTLKNLAGIFEDEEARQSMDQNQIIYDVDAYFPVNEGKKGGLFWGVTRIHPGKVGKEYFMTRGHFHAEPDTAEFYWGIQGKGILICMDANGNSWAESICPDSLHYIAGCVAHRVANISPDPLVFGACWPSDAGHDYETIEKKGFSARLMEENGQPTIIQSKSI